MFSDSRAPAAEQRAFKPHAPHFIPWLRNSLKSQHAAADLGLSGPYKSNPELHDNLERTRGIGIFSIPGKNKAKKSELRCNGVGVARMLPVVLRGHHILGKPKDGSPAKSKAEAEPNPVTPQRDGSGSSVKNHGPAPTPEAPNCTVPLGVCVEDRREDVWDYTVHQRDLRSSVWLTSNPQGPKEGHGGFRSSFSYISRNCQSQRDLTVLREAPPVEGINGVIFPTEIPHRGLGFTTTLRGPGKHGSKRVPAVGQNQTRWLRHRAKTEEESHAKGAGCSRKVVRRQLKRVVENLEQVLAALRDVQQEMREVVQQIDYLTSCIDLDEEDPQQAGGGDSSSSSGSSSNEVTVISTHPRASQSEDHRGATLRRDPPNGSRSPPNEFCTRTLRFGLGSSPKRGGLLTLVNNPDSSSPQRSLPVRPPTPGLSPLTVNIHPPGSPSSRGGSSSVMVSPISPVSPKPHPTAVLCPSVVIDHPATVRFCASVTSRHPSASCPPTDSETPSHADGERRASSAGLPVAATAKAASGQGRRGRKPPPYPHHRLSQPPQAAKEPRKAPPYPEKRRLLSTTV
ncbi:arginine-glutamic acid dipeptide repeats protein [Dunckerocampus dactyliophorus]|uniref:arginine-glutamic acid dipeptide repeats protein n=1 Tax=Dunckerocampus dactyliophorus TaxID=161453 RepID=UPI00240617E7|nr:arginine-glutamic acid dipeptide repeats protein [Dunckerocampus dactyliophorus]XP_054645493.1 arginine-glutamic acid dipeptide repeats protein [Dunckerocampus dactyliophorus]XP_054645494.1 arginine-glutamic acid dipeptide repeats protein [Dunckerocampus dactyliophorus]